MKPSSQIALPFVVTQPLTGKKETGISLNREKFIQYLMKSVEIDASQAVVLYHDIETELSQFHGKNPMEYLEALLSEKIKKYQVKKPQPPKTRLTTNAETVLKKRYLIKNERGDVLETPDQLFHRVAKAIAEIDRLYGHTDTDIRKTEQNFYEMISHLEFLPNSPTLMNAGKKEGQLAACFVLPIDDSMESIFDTLKHTALIQRSGGGTGFNFSKLRPTNSRIQSTMGVSSGPLSFISVFNAVTDTIKQGGTRRGANMAILNVDHPDILAFIHSKEDPSQLSNFNISVAVTDAFIKAVNQNENYPLIQPNTKRVVEKLNAASVFDQIVHAAWKTGDPGLIFIDRINEHNPTPQLGPIECTNPCGEQVLLPYEACNLGSINLNSLLKDLKIDWDKLAGLTKTAVHFLDNVIDANHYPLPQIASITKANRKIGLGIMGLADVLAKMKIAYNSEAALKLSEEIIAFIKSKAKEASEKLAKERGAFPNFQGSALSKKGQKPLRNATVISIAPTGTLSLIAGCSSGIEPIFARSYVKHVLEGEVLPETASVDPIVTAHEISPEWHVRMQALFQKYSDSAVSKTVNLPHQATCQDVAKTYQLAFELGCKGITIYRDRSKPTQVLNTLFSENVCPDCNSSFKYEESCTLCPNCGYTKCLI